MSTAHRVIWSEGMLLTPHHFQQADRHAEATLNAKLAAMLPHEWGVLDLNVNRDAIANGIVNVVECRAVFPDGLFVSIPSTDPTPPIRAIEEHFSAERKTLGVFLAVPHHRGGAANIGDEGATGSAPVRFIRFETTRCDDTTGENERGLILGRANVKILFEDELREGYAAIKIGEIERTPAGGFALTETYLPPALSVSALPWLYGQTRQILDIMIAKSLTLAERRRQQSPSLADFTTSEVAVFWLLRTINAAIPHFSHLLRTVPLHPEILYRAMAGFAGELMTFVFDRHPSDVVAYAHSDLRGTFKALTDDIKHLLETVIPTRCVAIPLVNTPERKSLYLARIHDERLLAEAAFFLGVHARIPESRLIDRVPAVVKIAANDVVDRVIGSAMPGVVLKHASPPPGPIPTRIGFHYFGLDCIGPFWDGIRGSKNLAVYIPDEFPEVRLELFAVKP